jgi:hypothetical protein
VLLGAVLALAGCGDDQLPWCSELASVADLEELATALSAGDSEGVAEGVERFTSVASSAPVEIRADMEAVADALSEVVEVAMTGDGADPEDLELRREAVNAQLGRVTSNVAAVSAWAEQECGIRLD